MLTGFLKIDKEEGQTSQDVDHLIKKRFASTSVGHLGTLDPFATGLLILGIGDGTRLFPLLEKSDKDYIATLTLGTRTDTGDKTGNKLENKDVPSFSDDTIRNVLTSLLGKQNQVPPHYSAKHINGERAYDLARDGIAFDLKPVPIVIEKLSFLRYEKETKELSFIASVSSGTYIRTLGEDIATRLGTCGFLSALRRTRVGYYNLLGSRKASDVTLADVIPLADFLPAFPKIPCPEGKENLARNGATLVLASEAPYVFLTLADQIIACYEKKEKQYVCYRGFLHD